MRDNKEYHHMEISYSLAHEDYWRFSEFMIRRVPALRRQMLLTNLSLPALVALETYVIRMPLIVYVGIILIGTIIWIAIMTWSRRRLGRQLTNARLGSIGRQTMSMSEQGFRVQDDYLETFVRWTKISDIIESRHDVILLLGPQYGFFLPKHILGLDRSRDVINTARAYWEAAQSGTPPMLPPVSESWPPAPKNDS